MTNGSTVLAFLAALAAAFRALSCPAQATKVYPWLGRAAAASDVAGRFLPPAGFERVAVVPGSFAGWLRHLPLRPEGTPVLFFDGRPKANQAAHAAVIDIDTGARDLQQCADAVIRLRAEFLYAAGRPDEIRFNFTSGDAAAFAQWRRGFRPVVPASGPVRWEPKAVADASHASFRKYLDTVFMYAGTLSLSRELKPRRPVAAMRAGDVFIHGGSPGHAALVVDVATNRSTGKAVFLLAQGYMPAQDVHILVNPGDGGRSPWYPVDFGGKLRTPEWEFGRDELMHFAGE